MKAQYVPAPYGWWAVYEFDGPGHAGDQLPVIAWRITPADDDQCGDDGHGVVLCAGDVYGAAERRGPWVHVSYYFDPDKREW